MPPTMEVATLWIACFGLLYTVFNSPRLPSFWGQEYANGKHAMTTRWFAYLFFPIWAVVLSCQAASYATFLQETPNDLYYAFLVVGICDVLLMHAWIWAWTFPIHPALAALLAVLIFGTQLTMLILAIVYNTTNDWVYWMIGVALAWKLVAAVWSFVAAVRLTPEFYDMQKSVASKDNILHRLLSAINRMTDSQKANFMQAINSMGGISETARAPYPQTSAVDMRDTRGAHSHF